MSYSETFFVDDVEFQVEFTSTPYIPAKVSGPPENCHPDEGGEVEIESIHIGEFEVTSVISEQTYDILNGKCAEAAPQCEEDERNSHLEDMAEPRAHRYEE